jgi:hypothetical protein
MTEVAIILLLVIILVGLLVLIGLTRLAVWIVSADGYSELQGRN